MKNEGVEKVHGRKSWQHGKLLLKFRQPNHQFEAKFNESKINEISLENE